MNRRFARRMIGIALAGFCFAGLFLASVPPKVQSVAVSSDPDPAPANVQPPKLIANASPSANRGPASGTIGDVGASQLAPEQITQVKALDAASRLQQITASALNIKKLDELSRQKGAVRIRSDESAWVSLPSVFALPPDAANIVPSGAVPWQTQFGYRMFEQTDGRPWPQLALPVVRVEGTEKLAVLTGAFSVKFRASGGGLPDFAPHLGLTPVQSFETIQIAYYQSQKRTAAELFNILDQIRRDPRVESAGLKTVDKIYVAR